MRGDRPEDKVTVYYQTLMAKTPPSDQAAKTAKLGIFLAGALVLLTLLFGTQRQLVAQKYLSATTGNTVETELIDISGRPSPSVEVVAQLQYTQQALFQTEVVNGNGESISRLSQDFNSLNSESSKRVEVPDWPASDAIKVKLSVASQQITATPPAGQDPAQAPVIFEVNVYSHRLSARYLWPAFFACVGLWIIATLASKRDDRAFLKGLKTTALFALSLNLF